MSVINVTMDNFQKEVMESDRPVLLDFWAGWCGPCRMVAPVLDEIAEENPQIKVAKINVEDQSQLASNFKVMGIPSLFVIQNGKIINRAAGARSKEAILSMLG